MDDGSDEGFRGLVLQLRGRVGLTQRALAARVGVHVHSVQAWEAGVSYPSAASLQRLVAVSLRAGGFTEGHESGEAAELWAAATREAPRLRTPFDRVWFDGLLGAASRPDEGCEATGAGPAESGRAPRDGARRQYWGQAPDVVSFLGRTAERQLLRRWVLDERCRVVAVLGLGGIGKTLLATRLAHELAPAFAQVYWRSLRDAPAPSEWLAGAMGFLAPDDAPVSGGEAAQVARLLELLSEAGSVHAVRRRDPGSI